MHIFTAPGQFFCASCGYDLQVENLIVQEEVLAGQAVMACQRSHYLEGKQRFCVMYGKRLIVPLQRVEVTEASR